MKDEDDDEDWDDRSDSINKCEYYIDSYFSSLVRRRIIIACRKYVSDAEIYWKVVFRGENDFFIRLDCRDGSLRTIIRAGREINELSKQFDEYMSEVMGTGPSWMPSVSPLPN